MFELAGQTTAALEDVTIVIPCAGEIDASLVPLVGKSSPAFIPLDGKPIICRTVQYLVQLGYRRFVIAIRANDRAVETLVRGMFGSVADFQFPVPDRNGELGYTLLTCTPLVKTSRALIVLGDTFFEFPEPALLPIDENFVLTHKVDDSFRWCLTTTSAEGTIQSLIDKVADASPGDALIGVYGISEWPRFAALLQDSWDTLPQPAEGKSKRMPLSIPLGRFAKDSPTRVINTEDSYDCGHVDNLIRARKRLVQKRSFNELRFDEVCSTILKSSTDTIKFFDEINYYFLLPPELQIFFPRVIRADRNSSALELEFYGYATLSELLLFEHLDKRIWLQIFEHLRSIQERFGQFRQPASVGALDSMYEKRVAERVKKLMALDPVLDDLASAHEVILNDKPLRGFPILWPQLKRRLQELNKLETFTVIHGDMCFSNILYDLSARVCKFIDPRGSFGDKGIYGDARYDVAKLRHSIHGHYDFIVNDLFRVNLHGNHIDLDIFAGEHLKEVQEAFESVFFQSFNGEDIALIEGILFITMGVFHTDRLDRQVAMFATGLKILNETLA